MKVGYSSITYEPCAMLIFPYYNLGCLFFSALLQICNDRGHVNKRWCSQPRFRFGQHVGDYKLACAILFTGGNYSKVATLLQAIDMKPVAQTVYTRIHGHYAVPAVEKHWQQTNESILDQFTNQDLVVLGKKYLSIR